MTGPPERLAASAQPESGRRDQRRWIWLPAAPTAACSNRDNSRAEPFLEESGEGHAHRVKQIQLGLELVERYCARRRLVCCLVRTRCRAGQELLQRAVAPRGMYARQQHAAVVPRAEVAPVRLQQALGECQLLFSGPSDAMHEPQAVLPRVEVASVPTDRMQEPARRRPSRRDRRRDARTRPRRPRDRRAHRPLHVQARGGQSARRAPCENESAHSSAAVSSPSTSTAFFSTSHCRWCQAG